MMLDKILNILERNKYQIILHTTETGFTMQFPSRIEFPSSEARIYEFWINDDNITIDGEIVPLPKYIHLTYCMSKMVVYCNRLKYNTTLVRYIHKNKDISADDFWNFVPFNMDEENKTKDKLLRASIDMFLKNSKEAMEEAKKYDLEDSLQFIIGILSDKEQK